MLYKGVTLATKYRKGYRGQALIWVLVAACVLLLILFVYKESSGFNIVEYELFTDKDIGSDVRFVMLSDLHDTDVTHDRNTKLFEAIKRIDPDFVILAGDMVTSYSADSYGHDNSFALMKLLAGDFPVYYGLGNHEQRYKEEPERFKGRYEHIAKYAASLGIHLLSNETADIDRCNVRIYGFDIPLENYHRMVKRKLPEGILEKTFGRPDPSRLNIMTAHTPDYFDEYAAFGPDIVLSGHLHGGVVAIPGIGGVISPQLKPFPKYDFGTFTKGSTTMIVSRGIGWHSIPIRIFNKAEIVSVTVKHKEMGDNNGDQR